ncbi:MAG: hypothetical protein QNJ29_03545 [Rhizobiaceae bacterium]|nr:hypothetical protein [Rhizobiaceae bacterium]
MKTKFNTLCKPYRSVSVWGLLDTIIIDLGRQFRWSYLPPIMVYFAAGISGITAIVGTFFVKEYLGISAEFLASLGFWAGLPWIMKMPLGQLVDLIWRWKFILVYLGASLIALSLSIMYGLIAHTQYFTKFASVETWFVTSALLSPTGYVIQDVVADAMTVEAIPSRDHEGNLYSEDENKAMHTTMQLLGRVAIVSGTVAVALLNVFLFSDVSELTEQQIRDTYALVYLLALVIPVISVLGVSFAQFLRFKQVKYYQAQDVTLSEIDSVENFPTSDITPKWQIFAGSIMFVCFTLLIGLGRFPYGQEIVFVGSLLIILLLIHHLLKELPNTQRNALIGTAAIIFVFRAIPLPGAGVTWWEVDALGFDQQFLAVLTVVTSILTLVGMVLIRPVIAKRSIAYVIVLLTLAGGFLSLPNIGLFYGIQEWTSARTNGVVDARFIAILDTMLESPLGQIAMIPMLAWIARNAPVHLKATYFAVMASFTNLALSASSLGTKYLNRIYIITREVTDPATNDVVIPSDYTQVGMLLITVMIIGITAPIVTVMIVQRSRYKAVD